MHSGAQPGNEVGVTRQHPAADAGGQQLDGDRGRRTRTAQGRGHAFAREQRLARLSRDTAHSAPVRPRLRTDRSRRRRCRWPSSTRRWRDGTGRRRTRRSATGSASPADEWRTIVGVARDIKYARVTEEPRPHVYLPADAELLVGRWCSMCDRRMPSRRSWPGSDRRSRRSIRTSRSSEPTCSGIRRARPSRSSRWRPER